MKKNYILKIMLSDEVWENIPEDIEPYDYLQGLESFYNELLEKNNCKVIITSDLSVYDFISYDDNYEDIENAYYIISDYDDDLSSVYIVEYN